MVYLFLKEVAESTDAAEVIIVVQSLCKDMNNNVDVYRSNAIRTLAKIIDVRGCRVGVRASRRLAVTGWPGWGGVVRGGWGASFPKGPYPFLISAPPPRPSACPRVPCAHVFCCGRGWCGGGALQGPMLGQIERYVKQAICDNNDTVSSAAILCGLQLASVGAACGCYALAAGALRSLHPFPTAAVSCGVLHVRVCCSLRCQAAPDVVRRWVNEIQTVMTTKSDMVQYHALALMHTIKHADKLAISKVGASRGVGDTLHERARAPDAALLFGECLLASVVGYAPCRVAAVRCHRAVPCAPAPCCYPVGDANDEGLHAFATGHLPAHPLHRVALEG
jgi:hypothetical protein